MSNLASGITVPAGRSERGDLIQLKKSNKTSRETNDRKITCESKGDIHAVPSLKGWVSRGEKNE